MLIAGINELFGSWRAIAYSYSLGLMFVSVAALIILKEDPVFLFDSGKLK
jgi:tetrahydromethanopterin S-methyltransferase subunit B